MSVYGGVPSFSPPSISTDKDRDATAVDCSGNKNRSTAYTAARFRMPVAVVVEVVGAVVSKRRKRKAFT